MFDSATQPHEKTSQRTQACIAHGRVTAAVARGVAAAAILLVLDVYVTLSGLSSVLPPR